jgi:flagellar biosynthesis protein FlhB
VLLALGALELVLQQLERLRRLRMTRREVVEEQREQESNPRLHSERRARAAAVSGNTSLAGASIVLTGQGRVLALRYRPEHDAAPVLWCKAEGAHAVRLLAEAYALGLPLASDAVLTGDLYRLAPGQAIPAAAHSRIAKLWVEASRAHA